MEGYEAPDASGVGDCAPGWIGSVEGDEEVWSEEGVWCGLTLGVECPVSWPEYVEGLGCEVVVCGLGVGAVAAVPWLGGVTYGYRTGAGHGSAPTEGWVCDIGLTWLSTSISESAGFAG